MANKKTRATTTHSASATAKRNPLGNTGIRLFGAFLAFVGILLCLIHTSFINLFLTVFSVGCMLGGLFIAVSNLRKMIAGASSSDVLLYLLAGILVLVAGILLYVFKGTVQKWFIVILGTIIAVYGLALLIKFVGYSRGTTKSVFGAIVAFMTIVSGILIAILVVSKISSASNGVCYYIFGVIAAATGLAELLFF